MGSFLFPNIPVLIAAIIFWINISPPNLKMLTYSTIACLFDILSINFLYQALSRGPGGPITAISNCAAVVVLFVEALKYRKLPSWLEFLALTFGLLGALMFGVPEMMRKIFCSCCKVKN